jgi:hypothetical protein
MHEGYYKFLLAKTTIAYIKGLMTYKKKNQEN